MCLRRNVGMPISRFTIENYVLEINEYFRARTKKKEALSIAECNSYFKTTDSYLRTIISGMKNQIRKERIPTFGIPVTHINVSPKGILGKKCCDCPNEPVPFKKKNQLRRIGEKYMTDWAQLAQMHLDGEKITPNIGAKTKKPMTTKRPF